jgi:uncharacterized protein (TIGR03437 family)
MKFRFTGVEPAIGNPPNFVILAPASGVTPQLVHVALNPIVAGTLQPGRGYSLWVVFTSVDETPVQIDRKLVRYTVPVNPTPVISGVLNTASLQPFLSPGTLITVAGSDLASPALPGNYDENGLYPRTLGNTTMTIGGIAAPLLQVSPNQINAVVPYDVPASDRPEVVVTHFGRPSLPVRIDLQDTSPGIYTFNQTGTGQATIRQMAADRTFSFNGPENPASPGTAFEMYCTGAGVWSPAVPADVSFGVITMFRIQPVSVMIAGQAARVLYAGRPGGGLVPWGYLQVNAIVPEGVGPGAQSIVVKFAGSDSSQQPVTIAVK